MILEGSISVKAAILGNRRKVKELYIDEKRRDKESAFIMAKAAEAGIPIRRMPRHAIDAAASGKTHGGILCEADGRIYDDPSVLFSSENPFLVVLEGVEDPFNLGYVIRALYSGGCTGLVINSRSWESADSVILKSSAGAYDYLPIVMSEDPAALIKACRRRQIHAFAAMRKDAKPCYEADFTGPILLAIGGEMRGLSTAVLNECDENIYIPYANDFRNALNAAGASAVLGFEVLRQRRYQGGGSTDGTD